MSGHAAEFDPYHKWLGIPPRDQPPNYYRLLGLQLFEADEEVVESAASRLIAFCEQHAHGPHAADARRIVFEIASARLCLLDPAKRGEYDAQLRSSAAGRAAAGVTRNPAARPSAATERRAAPPPPPRAVRPPAQAEHGSPVTTPETPDIVAPKSSAADEHPFSFKIDTGPHKSRHGGRSVRSSHQSSSMELDEMLSGLSAELQPPTAAPTAVPPLPATPPPARQKPMPRPAAMPDPRIARQADAGELNALFGPPPMPPKSVPVTPSTPGVVSELDDLFGALAGEATGAAAKKGRKGGRTRTVNASEEGDLVHDRKTGRKQKDSKSVYVVGGLAALTVLVLIAAVILLLGGDDTPQTAKKSKASTTANDDSGDEATETSKPKADDDERLETKDADKVSVPEPEAALEPADTESPPVQVAPAHADADQPATEASKKDATERLLELSSQGGSDLEIKKLIAAGANVEVTDVNQRTPLRLAIIGKHFLLAKALIAAKADVNATDARGETALMTAAQQGDEKIIRLLLDANADSNLATVAKGNRPAGTTPLHVAARHGNTAAIRLLVEHGARLEKGNQQGVTPLMVAAWQGQEEAALALLEKGADVKTAFDAAGQSPLMHAAHGGNLAIVEAMIAKGAQSNYKSPTGATALSIALGSPEANEAVVNKLRRLSADEAPALDF